MIGSPFYTLFLLAGIVGGAVFWSRLTRRDDHMMFVFTAALIGAFLGAKAAYIISEGAVDWTQPDRWWRLAAGKSITGALLFGYLSVEGAKKVLGIQSVTGDWFAAIVPSALALGRFGCFLNGCCPGQLCPVPSFSYLDRRGEPRYPAALAELLFNLAAVFGFFLFRRRNWFRHQHFHIYLMASGVFRFFTEFWRATPRVAGPFSGYHLFALLLLVLGATRCVMRSRAERRAALAGLLAPAGSVNTIRNQAIPIMLWLLVAGAYGAESEKQLPADIEMNPGAGYWARLIVNVRTGSEEARFLLDTGASITILDKSLESSAGKRVGRDFFDDWNGRHKLELHAAPSMALRGAELSLKKVGVRDFALPRHAGLEQGILGMDCLSRYCIQFDFQSRKIRFLDRARLAPADLGREFPITFRDKLPYIHSTSLTGANETELLVDTGYDLDGRVSAENSSSPGVLHLDRCDWNGWNYTSIAVRSGPGLKVLGLRFLARHLVTLDFPGGKMYLKPTRSGPFAARDAEAAAAFIKSLKDAGKLPDVLPNEHGGLTAAPDQLDTLVGWRASDFRTSLYKLKTDPVTGAFQLLDTRPVPPQRTPR